MSDYQKVVLTVEIVPEAERDKFQGLSRPETYHRIRPHYRVGQRGCYTVEMTDEELTQARRDTLDPDSNLIAAELDKPIPADLVPNQANLDYAGIRRLSEDGYDASGVTVAVIDRGITTAFRDAHFAGRVADAEDFSGQGNPYALYGGDEHGCYMAGLAVPPGADLIVAKVNLYADVAEAFYWIADETSADIVSISLSGPDGLTALEDAVAYADAAGVLIFASAGNDGNTTVNYPSSYAGAHKISNFDHRIDAISSDSTFGADVWAAAGGNDHNLWNASGAEIYLEAGGTSCATAMSARIAAYTVGKFGAGAAIARMETMARDAGYASNKQGVGVLQLVHAYEVPDPDGTPTTEDPNPTKEPILPVVPVGQTRNFDLQLPEIGSIEGPGTGTDPSGSGGSAGDSVCEEQLDALIATSDWSGLRDFIELKTGQAISDVVPAWNLVAEDGVTREAVVEVCGKAVHLTISGDLVTISGCQALPTATMVLPQHDFALNTTAVGENDEAPPGIPNPFDYVYYTTDQVPNGTAHVENPRMMWLSEDTDADTIAANEVGTTVSVGGVDYRSVVQLRFSYTMQLNLRTTHTFNYTTEAYDEDYLYNHHQALLGFRLLQRYSVDSGSTPNTSAAVREGTTYTSSGITHIQNTDYFDESSSTPGSWATRKTAPRQSNVANSASLSFEGTSTAEIQADIDDYNDLKSPQDPDVSFDEFSQEVTVSCMTRENALYLAGFGCTTNTLASLTLDYGGYAHPMSQFTPRGNALTTDGHFMEGLLIRRVRDGDANTGLTHTNFVRLAPAEVGTYTPSLSGAVADSSSDGRPPDTTPNPPIVPAGGGCRSSWDGPSSCTWTVPDTGDVPLPGDFFDNMPVFDTRFPKFPFDCHFPDFGNMDPCGPGGGHAGSNAPGPGGRDRAGRRGSSHGSVKTGGPSYGNPRKKQFTERTCPGQSMPGIDCYSVITMFLMDCGVSALDIIFQCGPEWDKPFPVNKCFARGSRIWDAAEWTARYLGMKIIDEGKPTHNIYIGPPWHRPGQSTWTFSEHYDLFELDRGFSGEELYSAVLVFGPNGTSLSTVESPFVNAEDPIKQVEVGGNYSQGDMDRLAAFHAGLTRREAASVQATVPYSIDYFIRDKAVTQAPDIGIEETWVIMGKESKIDVSGWLHILTLMLPETVRELDLLPTSVATVGEEVNGTVYAP